MFDILKKLLGKAKVDYADIRYEIKKETIIAFNGRELTQVGTNSTDGYVIRVLNKGGLATASFTDIKNSEKALKLTLENANIIGTTREKPVKMAKTETITDTFIPALNEDPRKVPLEEKVELTKKYNGIPLSSEKVITTNISYREVCREKYFVTSEGSKIREDLITTQLGGLIVAKEGNLIQNIRVGVGGSNGFSNVRNKESEFEERTAIVMDILKSQPVKGGVYNCILNPNLAGVFTHEAFGHFSEADIIETIPSMREKMEIGSKLGSDILNITDDATIQNQLGFYKYDDEGVKVRKTQLIKNGVLSGRLHSRRTSAEFNEPLSGHTVAEDYRYAPIIRMGNIFIEPGKHSLDELFKILGDGLYILDAKGGQTAGENFTFGAQYGYIVKGGKQSEMVRDINISGNLYKTLKDISAIGSDLVFDKNGGCGKGQMNIRSCSGGSNIIINNLVVGGV
jgi:TldD protein